MRKPKVDQHLLGKLENLRRRATQGDVAYFMEFPNRKYRVRDAVLAEIQLDRLKGCGVAPRPGKRLCRAVAFLPPHLFINVPVGRPLDEDPHSLDEDSAQAIFEATTGDRNVMPYLRSGINTEEAP